MSVQGLNNIGRQELIKLYQNNVQDDTNLEEALTNLKALPKDRNDILTAAKNGTLTRDFLVRTLGDDEENTEDITQILTAYQLDIAEAGPQEPGSEFFGSPDGTQITSIYIDDEIAQGLEFKDADTFARYFKFSSVDALNNWITKAALVNGKVDQQRANNILNNFAAITQDPELKAWFVLACDANKDNLGELLEAFASEDYSKNNADLFNKIIFSNKKIDDVIKHALGSDPNSPAYKAAMSLMHLADTGNARYAAKMSVLLADKEMRNDGPPDNERIRNGFALLGITNTGVLAAEDQTRMHNQGYGHLAANVIARTGQDSERELTEKLSDPGTTPEQRQEALDKAKKIQEGLAETRDIAKDLGYTDIYNAANNAFNSLGTVISAAANAPSTNPAAPPPGISVNTPTPMGYIQDTLTSALERLHKAENAEQFREALADVRAELKKLDELINENNTKASKLLAMELDAAARKKLEGELAEQKAAVQALQDLCVLAETLYSAGTQTAEQPEAVQQILDAMAELARWIAPQLSTEVSKTAVLLQNASRNAERAESSTESMRATVRAQVAADINELFEEATPLLDQQRAAAETETAAAAAQTMLFDIFVDLAFNPVVAGKFIPDIRLINIFIQEARTLAETIRLDTVFAQIADNKTREALEEFLLQMEKISALPGIQIVMGWKTKLEVLEAEQNVKNGIRPLQAYEELAEARGALAVANLPGMLTIWDNLSEAEKEYQETFIRKEIKTMSALDLAEMLSFNSDALPLELRGLVVQELKAKLTDGALDAMSPEQRQRLRTILSGAGESNMCAMVNAAIERNEQENGNVPGAQSKQAYIHAA